MFYLVISIQMLLRSQVGQEGIVVSIGTWLSLLPSHMSKLGYEASKHDSHQSTLQAQWGGQSCHLQDCPVITCCLLIMDWT